MRYPNMTYFHCFENEVGIIINVQFEKEGTDYSESQELEMFQKAWRPIKSHKWVYYLSKFTELTAAIVKKLIYQPVYKWPSLSYRLAKEYLNR
jgi:hypothetical protein